MLDPAGAAPRGEDVDEYDFALSEVGRREPTQLFEPLDRRKSELGYRLVNERGRHLAGISGEQLDAEGGSKCHEEKHRHEIAEPPGSGDLRASVPLPCRCLCAFVRHACGPPLSPPHRRWPGRLALTDGAVGSAHTVAPVCQRNDTASHHDERADPDPRHQRLWWMRMATPPPGASSPTTT